MVMGVMRMRQMTKTIAILRASKIFHLLQLTCRNKRSKNHTAAQTHNTKQKTFKFTQNLDFTHFVTQPSADVGCGDILQSVQRFSTRQTNLVATESCLHASCVVSSSVHETLQSNLTRSTMFLAKLSKIPPSHGLHSCELTQDQRECDTAAYVYALLEVAVYRYLVLSVLG